jgi:hypothetical protein
MFLSEWREFPSAPCIAGKENLITDCVSMLLKSRMSLTCFRTGFLPGRTMDLSAPRYKDTPYKHCEIKKFTAAKMWRPNILFIYIYIYIYRVIQNDCRGVNNLSYTIHLVLQMHPHVISLYGVTSRIRFMFLLFPQEVTNQNRHWNHHRWHATYSLERTRLSCWCL